MKNEEGVETKSGTRLEWREGRDDNDNIVDDPLENSGEKRVVDGQKKGEKRGRWGEKIGAFLPS